ncbi:MAG TPA: GAF domain-containing protein [Sphingomicrobium sp.]
MADEEPRAPRTNPKAIDAGAPDFLRGGGELGALMRAHDWEGTPLGPPSDWPQSLKSAVALMLPSAAQIVIFWGHDFVAFYNDAYAPTIGDKHPRALGRPARENWSELWEDLEPLLQSVLDTGETVNAKDRPFYIERHGYPETVYFDISYSAIPEDGGSVGGVLCIVNETTEGVLSEEALRESEHRLRLAAEAADVGTWDFKPETGALRWDDRCKGLFGVPADAEVTYDIFLKGLHPEDRSATDGAVQRALQPDGPGEYDVEYRTIGIEDGIERWIAAKGRAIFDGVGKSKRATRFIGTVIDISERRRAADELSEESHNLEILNRTGAAIAGELGLDRVVQLVTDAGVELTGAQFGAFFYNVVDEKGESYTLYTLSGVDRSAFDKFPMPRNTKVFGPTFKGEGVVRSDDITKDPRYGQNAPYYGKPKGHLPVVSYLAVPVIGRSGEVIGGLFFGHERPGQFKQRHERLMEGIAAQAAVAIDNARLFRAAQHEIEQRVKAEQALSALNETLESRVTEEIARRAQAEDVLRHAQKMETVGQLSGGIAHDFNNLLQIIHGNLTLLQRSVRDMEPRLQRPVTNALTGTERAAALTQRLLAFSRRQPLDPRALDVNRMIADMIELLHRTLGETVVIETRLSDDIPSAHVDGNQLENAILNLAINARDAMPRGGVLEIATGFAELDSAAAELHPDATSGQYVRIAVRDTGEGMSAEVLSRAVEPFFSTKEVGQGTGLGLSMVYGFAKQSGGHLLIESVEGEGTTVELFVPRSAETAQARQAREQAELPTGQGERILLCEDDEDVRRFSSETLSDLGYEVIEASDAASALDAMRQSGRVDLLFTDIVLPGGRTGADLAREARALQPDLKVLFATGYARSSLEERQEPGSSIELLLKPFGVEALAMKIRDILA